jgi:hypothetical protein
MGSLVPNCFRKSALSSAEFSVSNQNDDEGYLLLSELLKKPNHEFYSSDTPIISCDEDRIRTKSVETLVVFLNVVTILVF